MPPARVLAAVHWYVPHYCTGAEVMLHTMLRALVERGSTVDVLECSPAKDDSFRHSGYRIDGIRVHPHRGTDDLPRMLAAADVLVAHLDTTERSAAVSRRMGKPCFVIHHNDDFTSWNADADIYQVYNSQWLRDRLQTLKPTPRHLVVRPPVRSAEYRTEPGSRVTLVNLSPDKGSRIFYGLARRMPDVDFLGVIGAYGEQIVEPAPNVEIMAHTGLHSMASVYGRTRVLLVPSRYESWGRTGVEAMASGIPVVARPTPGLVESLGGAGVFVPDNSLAGWESAVRQIMDEDTWREASRRALDRSRELDRICEEDLRGWCAAVENASR